MDRQGWSEAEPWLSLCPQLAVWLDQVQTGELHLPLASLASQAQSLSLFHFYFCHFLLSPAAPLPTPAASPQPFAVSSALGERYGGEPGLWVAWRVFRLNTVMGPCTLLATDGHVRSRKCSSCTGFPFPAGQAWPALNAPTAVQLNRSRKQTQKDPSEQSSLFSSGAGRTVTIRCDRQSWKSWYSRIASFPAWVTHYYMLVPTNTNHSLTGKAKVLQAKAGS